MKELFLLFCFLFGAFFIGPWIASRGIESWLYCEQRRLGLFLHGEPPRQSPLTALLVFVVLWQRPIRPVLFGSRVILRAASFEMPTVDPKVASGSDKLARRLATPRERRHPHQTRKFRGTYFFKTNETSPSVGAKGKPMP